MTSGKVLSPSSRAVRRFNFLTKRDEALLLLRMDTNIALAGLASGRAVRIGAECRREVHDAPPGCAWKHGHEKYVWALLCFTTSPHHGLV